MRLFFLCIFISGYAMGGITIKGVLENGSGDGEGTADQLILMTLTGGMQTVAHLENVTGSFEIEYDGEFEPGKFLLQAMKGPVFYSSRIPDLDKPLTITLYDNASEVTLNARMGSLALYAYEDKLDIGMFFNLDNVNNPAKTLLSDKPVFSFPLIPGYNGLDANTLRGSAMPLKQNLSIENDMASLSYPLKPGRTQLMVRSMHSYLPDQANEYTIPLLENQKAVHVLLMPMNMDVSGLGLEPAGEDKQQGVKLYEWTRQEGQTELKITVTGKSAIREGETGAQTSSAGSTTSGEGARQDQHGQAEILNTPNPLSKYRWYIVVGVLAIFSFLTVISFKKP